MYARRVDPSALGFSLSSHRHSYIRLFVQKFRFVLGAYHAVSTVPYPPSTLVDVEIIGWKVLVVLDVEPWRVLQLRLESFLTISL